MPFRIVTARVTSDHGASGMPKRTAELINVMSSAVHHAPSSIPAVSRTDIENQQSSAAQLHHTGLHPHLRHPQVPDPVVLVHCQ